MTTANFMRYEAKNIYSLDVENNSIEELKELIKNRVAGLDMQNVSKGTVNNEIKFNPDYPLEYVTTVYTSKSYGDVDFEIHVHVFIVEGYHEGANVDYLTDVFINGVLDGGITSIQDEFFHLIDYTDKMNKGICTIQTKNVKNWANKVHTEITEKLEVILGKSSKDILSEEGKYSSIETEDSEDDDIFHGEGDFDMDELFN